MPDGRDMESGMEDKAVSTRDDLIIDVRFKKKKLIIKFVSILNKMANLIKSFPTFLKLFQIFEFKIIYSAISSTKVQTFIQISILDFSAVRLRPILQKLKRNGTS